MSGSTLLLEMREKQPFIYAREKFLRGEMLVEQAIQAVESDEDFMFEVMACRSRYANTREAAEAVVLLIWAAELVERIKAGRR